MRCACRVCGAYMVQVEEGLQSGCKCPECLSVCRDCMGSDQPPMSVEELRTRAELLRRAEETEWE